MPSHMPLTAERYDLRGRLIQCVALASFAFAAVFAVKALWPRPLSPESAVAPIAIPTLTVRHDTPVATFATRRIADMDVGMRVVAPGNPAEASDLRFGEEVCADTWQLMELRAPKVDGTVAEVRMIRPRWWLAERDVQAGGKVEIDVPECGIEGLADVLKVGRCPTIEAGPGRVVTATFKHQSAAVFDVAVEGLDEPIGTTGNHPFWSEDRQAFVRADALFEGERLRTLEGISQVVSVTERGPPEPVFNLEVQVDHIYCVAESGVLVHNGTSLPAWFTYEMRVLASLGLDPSQLQVKMRSAFGTRILDGVDNAKVAYEITTVNFSSSFDDLDAFEKVLQRKMVQLAKDGELLRTGKVRRLVYVTPDRLPTTGRGAEFTRELIRLRSEFGRDAVKWIRICL